MLTDEQGMWQAVLKNPLDTTVRSMFCDTLYEKGEPAAEYLYRAINKIPRKNLKQFMLTYLRDTVCHFELAIKEIQFEFKLGLPAICHLKFRDYMMQARHIVTELPITRWKIVGNSPLNRIHERNKVAHLDQPLNPTAIVNRRFGLPPTRQTNAAIYTEYVVKPTPRDEFVFATQIQAQRFLNKGLYYYARDGIYEDRRSNEINRFITALNTSYPRVQDLPMWGTRGQGAYGTRNWETFLSGQ